VNVSSGPCRLREGIHVGGGVCLDLLEGSCTEIEASEREVMREKARSSPSSLSNYLQFH
jgi:hypothetical protein